MPLWLLAALSENLNRLQAEETRSAATVAMLPHLKAVDRARVLNRLDRAMQRPVEKTPVEVIEVNPEKAGAYFAALGAKVVHRGSG